MCPLEMTYDDTYTHKVSGSGSSVANKEEKKAAAVGTGKKNMIDDISMNEGLVANGK